MHSFSYCVGNVFGVWSLEIRVGICLYCRDGRVHRTMNFLFICSDTFAVGYMYRLATIPSVTARQTDRQTDRQTERQTDDVAMPIADHSACSTIG